MYATIATTGSIRRHVTLAVAALAGLGLSAPVLAKDAALVEGASLRSAPAGMIRTPMAAPDLKSDVSKGFALLGKGKGEKAVFYFDKAIAAADSWLAGDARPRRCVAGDGTAGDGLAGIDEALCDAHFGRGYALIDMGRGDLAEADLRAAAQMAPDNAHFANEYAELFKSRRDWQQAYALFDKAYAVADKTVGGSDADLAARALRGMGYAKEKMGDLAEAKRLIEQSLTFEPKSEAGRLQLAHVERMLAIGS